MALLQQCIMDARSYGYPLLVSRLRQIATVTVIILTAHYKQETHQEMRYRTWTFFTTTSYTYYKYNRLVHKFRHRSTRRLCVGTHVYQIQWNNAM